MDEKSSSSSVSCPPVLSPSSEWSSCNIGFEPVLPSDNSITPPGANRVVSIAEFAKSAFITSRTRVPAPKSNDPAGTVFCTIKQGVVLFILSPVRSNAL